MQSLAHAPMRQRPSQGGLGCAGRAPRSRGASLRVAARRWRPATPKDDAKDPYGTGLGIYQGNSSAFYYPKVKTGVFKLEVDDSGKGKKPVEWHTTYAEPWFLGVTSVTHYLTYVSQLAAALAYYDVRLAHATGPVFLLVAGPLVQAMAGAGAILMHEYEGFQVSPFHAYDPLLPLDKGKSKPRAPQKVAPADQAHVEVAGAYNNDALRQAAYRSLFQLQALGAAMFAGGVFWPLGDTWPVSWLWAALGALGVVLYVLPRNVWYLQLGWLPGPQLGWLLGPPLPVWPSIVFLVFAIIQGLALMHLFGCGVGISIVLMLILGGVLEAGLAETTYDQRWHLLAVVLLNSGGWLQVAAVRDWWGTPEFEAAAKAVGLLVAVLSVSAGRDLHTKLKG